MVKRLLDLDDVIGRRGYVPPVHVSPSLSYGQLGTDEFPGLEAMRDDALDIVAYVNELSRLAEEGIAPPVNHKRLMTDYIGKLRGSLNFVRSVNNLKSDAANDASKKRHSSLAIEHENRAMRLTPPAARAIRRARATSLGLTAADNLAAYPYATDWIRWDGYEQSPVPEDCYFMFNMRTGGSPTLHRNGGGYRWAHVYDGMGAGASDIVAFRMLTPHIVSQNDVDYLMGPRMPVVGTTSPIPPNTPFRVAMGDDRALGPVFEADPGLHWDMYEGDSARITHYQLPMAFYRLNDSPNTREDQ